MAHFLMRWQFTDSSAKAMVKKPQDRSEIARTLVEGFGGKLHHYFFAFGEYDGLGIFEFPDNASATAFSMAVASTGAMSRVDTTVLLTSKEAEAAMTQARDTKTGYTPPNA